MAIGKALFVAALSITLTPVLGANPAHACSCYKGHVHRTEKVRTTGSSAACGVNLDGQGPFLVYAHKTVDGPRRLEMNLCGGTHALTKGEKVPYHDHKVH